MIVRLGVVDPTIVSPITEGEPNIAATPSPPVKETIGPLDSRFNRPESSGVTLTVGVVAGAGVTFVEVNVAAFVKSNGVKLCPAPPIVVRSRALPARASARVNASLIVLGLTTIT